MTRASVNGKIDVKIIGMCVVPIKISHQNCKKTAMTYICWITVVKEV